MRFGKQILVLLYLKFSFSKLPDIQLVVLLSLLALFVFTFVLPLFLTRLIIKSLDFILFLSSFFSASECSVNTIFKVKTSCLKLLALLYLLRFQGSRYSFSCITTFLTAPAYNSSNFKYRERLQLLSKYLFFLCVSFRFARKFCKSLYRFS